MAAASFCVTEGEERGALGSCQYQHNFREGGQGNINQEDRQQSS